MRDAGFVTLSKPCDRGDLTPGGLMLCTTSGNPDRTDVYNGDTPSPVHTFDLGPVARAGGSIWYQASDRTVEHWVEDAGTVTRVATQSGTDRILAMFPSVDDIVLRNAGTTFSRWGPDGGLVATPANVVSTGTGFWRSGDTLVSVGTTQWCQWSLLDGGSRCNPVTIMERSVSTEPSGLWVENLVMAGHELLHFELDDQRRVPLPTTAIVSPSSVSIPWDTGPWITTALAGMPGVGDLVVRNTADGVIFENYGPNVKSVTSSAVTRSNAGGTEFIRR
jgi:hypothetical protein